MRTKTKKKKTISKYLNNILYGDMLIIEICRYMKGWDYYTYYDQPKKFIDMIKERMRIDDIKAKQQN